VNKQVLMLALIPLVVSVMMTPAMAKPIGPQKAGEKNPHMEIVPAGPGPPATAGGVDAYLPSGGTHSWMANTEEMPIDIMFGLDASKARGLINKAEEITPSGLEAWMMMILFDPETALETLKNKWFYMPYETLLALFIIEGYTPEDAAAEASMWPEGMYVRFVNVGPRTRYFTIPGDADGDGYVGSSDFSILAGAYGTSVGDPAYDERADFNHDGYLGSADFSVLAGNYGKTA